MDLKFGKFGYKFHKFDLKFANFDKLVVRSATNLSNLADLNANLRTF